MKLSVRLLKYISCLAILYVGSMHTIYGSCASECDCSPSQEITVSENAFCLAETSSRCDLCCSDRCLPCGSTFYAPRSQGTNTARQLVQWVQYLYAPGLQQCYKNYSSIATTFEYTHSFNPEKIAFSLFCTDCLTFAGSQSRQRNNDTDIVADNFGLAPDFYRSLKIRPTIENFILEFSWYSNLSDWIPGFYSIIHAPLTYTRWDLGLNECVACASKPNSIALECEQDPIRCGSVPTKFFPANYMTLASNLNEQIPALPSLRQGLQGLAFADMRYPWTYGKFSFCPRGITRIADLTCLLGINFFESLWSHFGFYTKVVAPTGNKPKGKYIFEPIAGNRGHWELGGGLSAHATLWSNPFDSYSRLSLYFDGNITHMFESNEMRSFDFTQNGLLSRYLLLKKLQYGTITTAEETNYTLQYDNELINGINFATRNALVSIDVKGDASLMLSYSSNGFGWDLGYNIYGRTEEKVCIKTSCPCTIDTLFLGIKGTEGVGFANYALEDNIITSYTESLPLNSTQSEATIFAPTTTTTVDNSISTQTEQTIGAAYNSLEPTGSNVNALPSQVIIANYSIPPVIVNCKDLNPNSAVNCSQLTHKIFFNINYRWLDTEYSPHIGLGTEIEFDNFSKECICDKLDSNLRSGLNQFGIWAKGGITF